MTGYVRTDTVNNIADGNVISAADLDGEFNAVQAGFNSSTGHTHDGTSAEGAPITKLGPAQDVTISTTVLGVKTTNTVDLGTSSLKFKDFYLAGAASIGGTLTYGGVTLSNAVTGTGSMVLSASPTLTGTITAAAANFSGAVALNGNATIGDADTDTITQAASYVTGTQLKSAKTATNTLSLAAYDVDGAAYTNLITLTASNTPTLALTSTGVGTINNMSIGATTASTGAFSTLSATGATTITAQLTASTGDGTYPIISKDTRAFSANVTGPQLGFFGLDSTSTNNSLGAIRALAQTSQNGTLEARVLSGGSITTIGTFSSTGLAVTGRISVSGTNPSIQQTVQNLQLDLCGGTTVGTDPAIQILGSTTTSDANKIFYNANAHVFRTSSGGSTYATIDTSGNLGIGTTTPSVKLETSTARSATVTSAIFGLTGTGAVNDFNKITLKVQNTLGGSTGGAGIGAVLEASASNKTGLSFYYDSGSGAQTDGMRLDSSGRLMVGAGPNNGQTYNIGVYKASSAVALLINSDNGYNSYINFSGYGGGISFGRDGATGNFRWNSANDFGGTQWMTLDTSGNLLVGGTGLESAERLNVRRESIAGSPLTVNVVNTAATTTTRNASALMRIASNASGADTCVQFTDSVANNYWFGGNNGGAYVIANSNGVRLSNGGTSWASDSDERIKTAIVPFENAIEKVCTLRSGTGRYLTDNESVSRSFLIAQDVQAVLPEAVVTQDDEIGTLSLAYTDVIPLLVKAIQEQQALITQLTARITALEGA